jgi:hypothetical protein
MNNRDRIYIAVVYTVVFTFWTWVIYTTITKGW